LKAADATEPGPRRKAVAEFLDAWATEIAEHFDDEERLLGPHLDDEERRQLLSQHGVLRDLAGEATDRRAQVEPGIDWVRELGQRLNDHIRWEERQLFPALEQRLEQAQLTELAQETERIEASRPRAKCQQNRET
jgi:hemerythrin-like domain-containing protein